MSDSARRYRGFTRAGDEPQGADRRGLKDVKKEVTGSVRLAMRGRAVHCLPGRDSAHQTGEVRMPPLHWDVSVVDAPNSEPYVVVADLVLAVRTPRSRDFVTVEVGRAEQTLKRDAG